MIPSFDLNQPGFLQTTSDVTEHDSHALWMSFPVKKRAAVLALITPSKNGLAVVLTKRSSNLRTSPGLSAFPGGKVDSRGRGKKPEDEWTCALREALEETGFDPTSENLVFSKLGILPCYLAVNYIVVRACVAYVESTTGGPIPLSQLCPSLSSCEVELVYSIDLAGILKLQPWYISGETMQFVIGYEGWIFHDYEIPLSTALEVSRAKPGEGDDTPVVLQGLTAHIIQDLARIMLISVKPEMKVTSLIGSNQMIYAYQRNLKMAKTG